MYGFVDPIYLGAADVEVLNLAELGQSSLECDLLDLAEYVLNVGALLVRVNGRASCASLLLLVSSDALPARSFTLACCW
jgi:hypothetical protein